MQVHIYTYTVHIYKVMQYLLDIPTYNIYYSDLQYASNNYAISFAKIITVNTNNYLLIISNANHHNYPSYRVLV